MRLIEPKSPDCSVSGAVFSAVFLVGKTEGLNFLTSDVLSLQPCHHCRCTILLAS